MHHKVDLRDAVDDESKQQFKELFTQYQDVFSVDSPDIRKTGLVTMAIDTGDSSHISIKPYTLPLKHATWVQNELLEKASIIVRSVLPWASPIGVVPKKLQPDKPPRRRLCIDYRTLNNFLPTVTKAHSMGKVLLNLTLLSKIRQIYARLNC